MNDSQSHGFEPVEYLDTFPREVSAKLFGINVGSTPWGPADLVTECLKGVFFVSTPSHGGFYLSPWRAMELPPAIKDSSFVDKYELALPRNAWWEEDCDAPRIAAFFGLAPTGRS